VTEGSDIGASGTLRVEAGEPDGGARLDRFIAGHLTGFSRSRIQALIRAGRVICDGRTLVDPGGKVKPGQTVLVDVPEPAPAEPAGEDVALAVVFEDAHLIVIDKPAGLVVHPSAGHETGTLVNALIGHCGESLSGIGGIKRPGIVHRLDKDTSGLLVVAKTDQAHAALSAQFAAHGIDGRMTRRYLAIAWATPPHKHGRIDAALARSTSNRTKIAVTRAERGRHAVTHYEVLEGYDDAKGKPMASLIACTLETGRTHQIRVHLAHIGNPIMGDPVYGTHFAASVRRLTDGARSALEVLGRQALHAGHLGFEHPKTGKRLSFDCPLPPDMARLVAALSGQT